METHHDTAHRTGEAVVTVTDHAGAPVPGATV